MYVYKKKRKTKNADENIADENFQSFKGYRSKLFDTQHNTILRKDQNIFNFTYNQGAR